MTDDLQGFKSLPNANEPTQYPAIDESETDLCRAIWIAVIVQAVIDAKSNRKRQEYRTAKKEAIKWLEAKAGEESEFAEICSLAGLDFRNTQKQLLEIIHDKNRSVNFHCLKKALMDNRNYEPRSKYLRRMCCREQQRAKKTEPEKA